MFLLIFMIPIIGWTYVFYFKENLPDIRIQQGINNSHDNIHNITDEMPLLVKSYNQRIDSVRTLSSENVSINVWLSRVRIKLSGQIYYERAGNCRIIIRSVAGKEADFGMNSNLFWLWAKRLRKELQYANLKELDKTHLKFQYRPENLVGYLCLDQIDTSDVKYAETDKRFVVITKRQQCPNVVARMIYISKATGLVDGYVYSDENGKILCSGEVVEYQGDIPRKIAYSWTDEKCMALLEFENVQVNSAIPGYVWDMPDISPKVDIAKN